MLISYFTESKLKFSVAILIVIISVGMHFNHFSKELIGVHVWRQTQTQSTINSFYKEDFNIFHPKKNERGDGDGIFRMEFPLMQWCVALLYKLLGNNILITRVCMFFIGLFSILGIYKLLFNIFLNEKLALIGAWAFNFSPCFYYYTINPLPDNLALCCGIWGLALFFLWIQNQKIKSLLFSGMFLSIATLCKLPFIIYYSVPVFYFANQWLKNKSNLKILCQTFVLLSFIIAPLSWYFMVIPEWKGNGVVHGVLENQISFFQFWDYLQGNLVSTLPELMLNYGSVPFFLVAFYYIKKNKGQTHQFFPLLLVLSLSLSAYFFFEINMIGTVHDYYLFPFYPILFLLVSYGAYQLLMQNLKWIRIFAFSLLLILPVTTYIRMHVRWNLESPGFNKDFLIYKNELRRLVSNDALCVVGNDVSHFVIFYFIDKKGWGFDTDKLTAIELSKMISKGAKYIYSDSRLIDENRNIDPFLDRLIFDKGSIKVYSLKQVK